MAEEEKAVRIIPFNGKRKDWPVWSGKFLSAFPILALIVIKLGDPHYYDEVMTHPLFIPGCIAVVLFLSLNLIVMRKLTDIKV